MYNLNVKYVLLADTLSRLVKPGSSHTIPDLDVHIVPVISIKPTHLQSLQAETKADTTMSQIIGYINNGWPSHIHHLPDAVWPYWCFWDELAILDGIIMKGNRVVVPSVLMAETLLRLHDGHQGLNSTLQHARRTVYWPRLQDDISDLILQCKECQIYVRTRHKLPEQQISVTKPMEMWGIDLMEHKGGHMIVAIDYISGYILMDDLQAEKAESVISSLNRNFRRFGLTESIITDNGPCFRSQQFHNFCQSLKIEHITSSPYYHEGKGHVKRAIQSLKQITD